MKRILIITSLLLSCCANPSYTMRRLNGESHAQIAESIHRSFCMRECDAECNKNFCNKTDWLTRLLFCKDVFSPRSSCLKECYIPYCKCNEKLESWNYGMCKGYCEGKKNEINDK